ncbi:hypothetical protein ABG768_021752 [Culter alburnus]|uniref:Uncharacterized protein n=1 Tax=Culter alburnus TaxID=194366 RepID=A0AAW2ASZ6_CULAL
MYARAVWVENGRETEGTVPNNWINIHNKTVRWPNTKAKEAYKMKRDPQEDWLMFRLIKIKMTSSNIRDCENYNLTSQAEEEEEEEEVVFGGKRKRAKKTFDDYVVDSDELEEESIMGNKLPPFPIAPTKLKPVMNELAENSTYSRHVKHKKAGSPKSNAGSRHSVTPGHSDSSRHSTTSGHSNGARHSNRSDPVTVLYDKI